MDVVNLISVEVIHLSKIREFRKTIRIPGGSTVRDAISHSRIESEFPDLKIDKNTVGVFSRKVGLDHLLEEGDRVEIYRPLKLSPNEIRKLRALRAGEKTKGKL